MWTYNKTLQYPINIKCPNPKLAKVIISQYRRSRWRTCSFTSIFISKIWYAHQLTDGASIEEIQKAGLGPYYTDHGVDVYPQSAAGTPFTAAYIACKGDPIANLQEDLAAEQKARATYEKLIDLVGDDPDVLDPLRFLREREIVHFQRFGEALRDVQEKLAEKKFYMSDNNNCMMNR